MQAGSLGSLIYGLGGANQLHRSEEAAEQLNRVLSLWPTFAFDDSVADLTSAVQEIGPLVAEITDGCRQEIAEKVSWQRNGLE